MGTSGGGGLKMRTRREGVKNGQIFAEVFYGWPLIFLYTLICLHADSFYADLSLRFKSLFKLISLQAYLSSLFNVILIVVFVNSND